MSMANVFRQDLVAVNTGKTRQIYTDAYRHRDWQADEPLDT